LAEGGGDGHRSGASVAGNHQKVAESTGATAAFAADTWKQNKVPIIKLDFNSQFGPLVQECKKYMFIISKMKIGNKFNY
jgi:hypothetical protein